MYSPSALDSKDPADLKGAGTDSAGAFNGPHVETGGNCCLDACRAIPRDVRTAGQSATPDDVGPPQEKKLTTPEEDRYGQIGGNVSGMDVKSSGIGDRHNGSANHYTQRSDRYWQENYGQALNPRNSNKDYQEDSNGRFDRDIHVDSYRGQDSRKFDCEKGRPRDSHLGGDCDRSRGGDRDWNRGGDRYRSRGGDRDRSRGVDREQNWGGERDRNCGGDRDRNWGGDRDRSRGGDRDRNRGGDRDRNWAGDRDRSRDRGRRRGMDQIRDRDGDRPWDRDRAGDKNRDGTRRDAVDNKNGDRGLVFSRGSDQHGDLGEGRSRSDFHTPGYDAIIDTMESGIDKRKPKRRLFDVGPSINLPFPGGEPDLMKQNQGVVMKQNQGVVMKQNQGVVMNQDLTKKTTDSGDEMDIESPLENTAPTGKPNIGYVGACVEDTPVVIQPLLGSSSQGHMGFELIKRQNMHKDPPFSDAFTRDEERQKTQNPKSGTDKPGDEGPADVHTSYASSTVDPSFSGKGLIRHEQQQEFDERTLRRARREEGGGCKDREVSPLGTCLSEPLNKFALGSGSLGGQHLYANLPSPSLSSDSDTPRSSYKTSNKDKGVRAQNTASATQVNPWDRDSTSQSDIDSQKAFIPFPSQGSKPASLLPPSFRQEPPPTVAGYSNLTINTPTGVMMDRHPESQMQQQHFYHQQKQQPSQQQQQQQQQHQQQQKQQREQNVIGDLDPLMFNKIGALQKKNLCLNCMKEPPKQSASGTNIQTGGVCKRCLRHVGRVCCAHCGIEFLQHHYCVKAEKAFGRSMCLACAKQMLKQKKDPSICRYCQCWSAWTGVNECDRCRARIARHGMPNKCEKCGVQGAFPHHRSAPGAEGQKLCFLCNNRLKKAAALNQKNKMRMQQTLDLMGTGNVQEASEKHSSARKSLAKDGESEVYVIEEAKGQIKNLQQIIFQRDLTIQEQKQKNEEDLKALQTEIQAERRRNYELSLEVKRLAAEMKQRTVKFAAEKHDLDKKSQVQLDAALNSIQELKVECETLQRSLNINKQEVQTLKRQNAKLQTQLDAATK